MFSDAVIHVALYMHSRSRQVLCNYCALGYIIGPIISVLTGEALCKLLVAHRSYHYTNCVTQLSAGSN